MTSLVRVRACYGALLIAFPDRVARTIDEQQDGEGFRRIIRVLGAREVAQAVICWPQPTSALLKVGAGVDVIHAASMLGLAAMSRRWRRPALLSALTATIFAAWDLRTASALSLDETTPPVGAASPRGLVDQLLVTKNCCAAAVTDEAAGICDHRLQPKGWSR